MKRYDFTVIGTAATVTVLKVNEMPEQGKTTAVYEGSLDNYDNGGMGFNICAGLSRLGAKVYPVLTYADVRQGRFLHEFAAGCGLPEDGIQDPPPGSAGTTIMIQDAAKNHMTLVTEYERRSIDSDYFRPQVMEDHFFADSRMAVYTVPMAVNAGPALQAVIRNGIPLCLSMRKDSMAMPDALVIEAAGEAAIIFANESETEYLRKALGLTGIEELFDRGKLIYFIETLGAEGSHVYYRKGQTVAEHYAAAVPPFGKDIETIGAGDGYVSGFLYGYLKGMDAETCAAWGSVVASFVIETEGSVTNLPDAAQMLNRLSIVRSGKEGEGR